MNKQFDLKSSLTFKEGKNKSIMKESNEIEKIKELNFNYNKLADRF